MAPAMRPPTERSTFVISSCRSITPAFLPSRPAKSGSFNNPSSSAAPLACAGSLRAAPTHARRVFSSQPSLEQNCDTSTLSVFATRFGSNPPWALAPLVRVTAAGCGTFLRTSLFPRGPRRSLRPMTSSRDRYPKAARIVRTSSETKSMKLATCSGVPGNFFLSSSRCVATPTGQRFMWQTRAMMQPSAIIAILPNPNSSPPIIAATTMSQPVFRPPSTRNVTRSRRPFSTNTSCTSLSPCSHGPPAYMMLLSGDAPVPPSQPEIWMTSALAFATPAAIVPMPALATSFTETLLSGQMWCKS
mmetsp:Transcript_123307/g.348434  ORF Transcript_123307/g.348434 Transcript_123307/m.348434 type:complete len:302 (+) Transcript_123307:903-1808(+)